MKKNVTINLFGQLYNIDEDAYELLNNYEESLRQHLHQQADGTEIFNDIESRIAELLAELKSKGTDAVTIEHIQDIISRIGKPEEIGGEEDEATDNANNTAEAPEQKTNSKQTTDATSGAPKRLYRDVENKMVAGVLAGLSKFAGGDVTWWRLGFVVLVLFWGTIASPLSHLFFDSSRFLINGWLILAYIILAIVVPAADTPADRLKMKGERVNPQTLADEVTDEARRKEQRRTNEQSSRNQGCVGKGCLAGFFTVIVGLLQFVLILAGILLLIPCGFSIFGLVMLFVAPAFYLQSFAGLSEVQSLIMIQNATPTWVFGLSLLMLFMLCFIPAYAAIHAMFSKAGKLQPMGTVQRVVWLVLWIAAAVALAFAMKQIVNMVQNVSDEEYHSHLYHQAGVDREFFFHSKDAFNFYENNHWRLLEAETQRNRYSEKGEYYTGEKRHRYIDGYNNSNLVFRAERTDTVAPGRYQLVCAARADNWGAYITVRTSAKRDSVGIEPFGNSGGRLWNEANDLLAKMDEAKKTSTEEGRRLQRIANANDGNGYGWSRHYIHHITVGPDSLVTYGVYANAALSISDANYLHWFSATDFELIKEK